MIKYSLKTASRTSELALYQTNAVIAELKRNYPELSVELVPVTTKGDKDQNTALHNLGQTGVFTKALDDCILSGNADIGIHSFKDYPTTLPEGLELLAVLPRDGYYDAFVPGEDALDLDSPITILSGSPRRKAQWLSKYPHHRVQNLRGNMNTRLDKIKNSGGGIVSAPGLERLNLLPSNATLLTWMIPAPAQGVIAVIGRQSKSLNELLAPLNHRETYRKTFIERDFMSNVEAGCASPLGALVTTIGVEWFFQGILLTEDGEKRVCIERLINPKQWKTAGKYFADILLENGGQQIMQEITVNQPIDVLCLKEITPKQRQQGLLMGLKLHDINVLTLLPKTFSIDKSSFFIVGSHFGATQLLLKAQELPEYGFCIGNKAYEVLRKSKYTGVLKTFASSDEVLNYIDEKQLNSITYYGAKNTSADWESHQIKRCITYTNNAAFTRLSRQKWDAIAVFSPLGIKSILRYNKISRETPVATIGPATAKACKAFGFHNTSYSDISTFTEVLKLINPTKK